MYFFTPKGFRRFISGVFIVTLVGYAIFNIGDHFDAVLWLGGFLLALFFSYILNTVFETDPLKQLIASSFGTIICFAVFICFIVTSMGDEIHTPFNPPPDNNSSQTYVESQAETGSVDSNTSVTEDETNYESNTSNSYSNTGSTISNTGNAIPMSDFIVAADSSLDGYPVSNLVDSDNTTTWAEGVEGSGEGQTIYFTYNVPNTEVQLNEIQISNGFIKNQQVFDLNNTVENITVLYNNNVVETFVLDDSTQPLSLKMPQTLSLKEDDTVALRIDTVYRRQSDSVDDTCITEVSFFS